MESMRLISRTKSGEDERKVIVSLTAKGNLMKSEAAHIPFSLMAGISQEEVNLEELIAMKNKLQEWIEFLKNKG
jgi:DNA-binding MarR family transcriptional regulator